MLSVADSITQETERKHFLHSKGKKERDRVLCSKKRKRFSFFSLSKRLTPRKSNLTLLKERKKRSWKCDIKLE
jgi:predicted nucleic acid-binding OB-fold protein